MPKLGRLELDGSVPVVAVGFGVTDPKVIEEATARGMDVAELRVDLYGNVDERAVLAEVAKYRDVPTIATIRIESEGGRWGASEAQRLQLFAALVKHVDAVDVELLAREIRVDVIRLAHDAGRLAVVSFHDLHKTPNLGSLLERVDEAMAIGADIVKIATLAQSDEAVVTLTRLLTERSKANLIVIAMGAVGTKSRVFFPSLGSKITFASVGPSTAPGQLELDEMVEQLRAFYPEYNERRIVEHEILESA